jgi:hypothetical protein
MDPFAAKQDPIIKVNYATANEHVPRAERNNRTVQERVRAAYHRLPYDDLPRTMVKYLVMELAKKLNYFPNKNGVSKYYSPRMILHQENIDYDRHCAYRFGEYVLAHNNGVLLRGPLTTILLSNFPESLLNPGMELSNHFWATS